MMSMRRESLQRLVQFIGETLAVAVDDAVLQTTFNRVGALLLGGVCEFAIGEGLQQAFQWIVALRSPIEDQVFSDLHFLGRDQVQRTDFRHVDDGAGHSRTHRMIEEHAVQYCARRGVQAEADVR